MAKSPDKVAAEARQHATRAVDAACKLDDILTDGGSDADILAAAKILEAAGCYIRRALAKGAIGGQG